jgi:hypothetical protein
VHDIFDPCQMRSEDRVCLHGTNSLHESHRFDRKDNSRRTELESHFTRGFLLAQVSVDDDRRQLVACQYHLRLISTIKTWLTDIYLRRCRSQGLCPLKRHSRQQWPSSVAHRAHARRIENGRSKLRSWHKNPPNSLWHCNHSLPASPDGMPFLLPDRQDGHKKKSRHLTARAMSKNPPFGAQVGGQGNSRLILIGWGKAL